MSKIPPYTSAVRPYHSGHSLCLPFQLCRLWPQCPKLPKLLPRRYKKSHACATMMKWIPRTSYPSDKTAKSGCDRLIKLVQCSVVSKIIFLSLS